MSTLIRWEPFREMAGLRNRMGRLFTDVPNEAWEGSEGLTASVWNPPVDVFDTPEAIVLKADLPDLSEKDVEISVEGNTLTLRGERKKESEVQEKDYYRIERNYGTFSRSFSIPPTVDAEKIAAHFSQGVLKISLPKREEAKPKQIKVKVTSDGK